MVVVCQKQLERSKNTIQSMLDDEKTYEEIGNSFGLNRGIIHLFMNTDYVPSSLEIRHKLGLEEGSEIIISIRKRDPKTGRLLHND